MISSLLKHEGVVISESMAFGLSASLVFAYAPFIKLGGMPLIAFRMPPRAIIKGVAKRLPAKFAFETFRTPEAGEQRLNQLLDQGKVVGMQTSVFWLPYIPEYMRFHFNAHNLVVYGREADEYLISDPGFEAPVRCHADDLRRARFAKGPLAPKGLLYYPSAIGSHVVTAEAILAAIRHNCKIMLGPVPMAGIRGIRLLANKIRRLSADGVDTPKFVGHVVRMQEEIGTGGAGFRFIYAAFLQEAAGITGREQLFQLSTQLIEIGDEWRRFAFATAQMVKGRVPMTPTQLAAMLDALAVAEAAFFKALKIAAK